MEILILGAHNCESKDSRLVSLLIDGVLALDAGSLTSSLSLSEQERIKSILLTHHHFDHIRDVATIGLNAFPWGTIKLYSIPTVLSSLTSHILNDEIYPDFSKRPLPDRPALRFFALEPLKPETIDGYTVLAVPVNHTVPTVGYQVTSEDGKSLFYTGDTGRGCSSCWEVTSPQLLIIEVTMPDRFEEFANRSGHLCPRLLRQELAAFRGVKGYLPLIIIVHLSPQFESEINEEIEKVAMEMSATITIGHEGMRIRL